MRRMCWRARSMLSICETRRLVPFFRVRWPPNLSISDVFKGISGPDSDSKLAPNIIDKYIQVCLALFFLYGGLIKLVPPNALPGARLLAWLLSPLPKSLVYFSGISEMLGGLGLILPTSLRILPILTPLAAIGLIIEMIGAAIFIPSTIALCLWRARW